MSILIRVRVWSNAADAAADFATADVAAVLPLSAYCTMPTRKPAAAAASRSACLAYVDKFSGCLPSASDVGRGYGPGSMR